MRSHWTAALAKPAKPNTDNRSLMETEAIPGEGLARKKEIGRYSKRKQEQVQRITGTTVGYLY